MILSRLNPTGLCSLSPSSSNSVLAFPGLKPGQVQLVDLAATERSPLNITAHDRPLVAIALNVEGKCKVRIFYKYILCELFSMVYLSHCKEK